MPCTTEQNLFIVEAYLQQKYILKAQLQFKKQYRCREFSYHIMFYRCSNKFRTHRTVNNLNHKDPNWQSHSGQPKSSWTLHNVATVKNSVSCSPSKSVCRRSQLLGINRESVRRILIAGLSLYPYKIHIKRKLKLDDMRKCKIMCQWFCGKIDTVPYFIDNFWFSDEEHFLLYGHVNSKNKIFWGSTSPKHCLQKPLHSLKCTAWVAISKHDIKPFWFEDNNEHFVKINTDRYVHVFHKFWAALGWQKEVIRIRQCFEQDLPTPHTLNESLAWLNQPQMWPTVVAVFTRLKSPIFLSLGISLGPGLCPQPPMYSWLENRNRSNNKSNSKWGMRESHKGCCPQDSSVLAA